jgi:hypothetical protein
MGRPGIGQVFGHMRTDKFFRSFLECLALKQVGDLFFQIQDHIVHVLLEIFTDTGRQHDDAWHVGISDIIHVTDIVGNFFS